MMFGLTQIGQTCLVGDGTHSKIPRQDFGVLYLTSRNFKDGRLDLSSVYYISELDFAKHFLDGRTALCKPEKGDLVFSIIGTIGEPYLVKEGNRFGISSSVAILRPNKALIDPAFLFHWLKGPTFQNALFGIMGGVAQGYVSLEMIRSLPVPKVSLLVQRRIADILSTYDALIENNLQRVRILEDMARSLYREWFVYFRFPGHDKVALVDSVLGPIPEGWEVKKLGDVANIRWGDTSTTKASYVEEGYSAYSASGLDGRLDHFDFDRKGVVLSAIGANCGKTWLARGKWSCIKNTIRFWSENDRIGTEYLFVATLGEGYWPRRGAAQPFISQGDAEKLLLVCPDSMTMARFTDFVDPGLEYIAILTEQNTKLRRMRDLLLPRLLSGNINFADAILLSSSTAEVKIKDHSASANEEPSSSAKYNGEGSHRPGKVVQRSVLGDKALAYPPKAERLETRSEIPNDQAPPIEQADRSDVLAVIRQVFSDGRPRNGNDAIREVAQALGYGRVGHRISDVLHTDLLTAVRRGILDNVEDELILLARSIAGYDRDFLKQQFLAALGRSWVERNDAIQNFCRWMGFRRTGQIIDETARSVINGLLRESRLEANGPNLIRRTS